MKRLSTIYVFAACLISLPMTTESYAQDLSSKDLSNIYKWSAEPKFADHMKERFKGYGRSGDLNFIYTSSVVAIAQVKSPARDISNLAKGRVIGALYLSSGSTRFKLRPGGYLISVKFDNKKLNWEVTFQNKDRKNVRKLQARVRKVRQVEFPITYVDRSVCFRADSWEVCF